MQENVQVPVTAKRWYRVTVTRCEYQSVLVKAASEEDAELRAIDKADRRGGYWEEDGAGIEVARLYELSDAEVAEYVSEDDDYEEEDV